MVPDEHPIDPEHVSLQGAHTPSIVWFAEQEALVPPSEPEQVQFHPPLAEALPMLHKFVFGSV
jgi:hypothetical protein